MHYKPPHKSLSVQYGTKLKAGAMKKDFAYINGVLESVLTEILRAQEDHPGLTCYLQPHGASAIKRL